MGVEILLVYLLIISFIAALICVFDKMQARLNKRRVSENTLFMLSILGGSAAMYIVMLTIRHKTRKKRFMIGLPIIFFLQLAVIIKFFVL